MPPDEGYEIDAASARRIDRAVRTVLRAGEADNPPALDSSDPTETLYARLTATDGIEVIPTAYSWKEVKQKADGTWAAPYNGRTGAYNNQPARPFIENLGPTSYRTARKYHADGSTGAVVLLRRSWCRQESGKYKLEWQIIAPTEPIVRFCKVKNDNDYSAGGGLSHIDVNPCLDSTGADVDTDTTFDLFIPIPSNSRCPNAAQGSILGYLMDENGQAVCVTDCMDDAIGTVKIWGSGDPPRGWKVYSDGDGLPDWRGRFIVGADPDSSDYPDGATGGRQTIRVGDHQKNIGTLHYTSGADTTDVVVDITDAAGGGATAVRHRDDSNDSQDIDIRPPFIALTLIHRYK